VAFIESPSFPTALALGSEGGPMFLTHITAQAGGVEKRNRKWRYPKHRYQVGLVNRTDAETELLIAFFNTVAEGQTFGFRFRDLAPGQAEGVSEVLGSGDGVATTFQLVKWYTIGEASIARRITKPVEGVIVRLDGTLANDYTVDTATGIVTFADPPESDVVVTATFTFDVPVRFGVDTLPIQRLEPNVNSYQSIPLLEVRDR
jgi:uncharacterized protein (TIGR02217 family)